MSSTSAGDAGAGGDSINVVMSADGKYAEFQSKATNLPGANGHYQIYVKNLMTGSLTLVSKDSTGAAGTADSILSFSLNGQAFSADDTQLVFATQAPNLDGIATGQQIVRLTSDPAPTLALAPITADDILNAKDVAGQVTVSGTSNATGQTVMLVVGGKQIGTATVDGSGNWSTQVSGADLAAGTQIAATVGAQNSYLSTTTTEAYTIDTTPPSVGFTQDVTFTGAKATLNGTVSDNVGVVGVEIFDGSTDLGAATLNGDGTWTLATTLKAGDHALSAVATDTVGNTTSTGASFDLQTGLKGSPYSSYEADFDSLGNLTGEIFTKKSGVVYKSDSVTNLVNGDHLIDYNAGSFFNTQNFFEETTLFDASYNVLVDTLYNNDGTHTITGSADKLQLKSLGNDYMTGGGKSDTFVFTAKPGQETITDFLATHAGHDIISLSKADFSNVTQILHNTHQAGQDALINLGHGNSITIQNVTVAVLKANQQDFKLHA